MRLDEKTFAILRSFAQCVLAGHSYLSSDICTRCGAAKDGPTLLDVVANELERRDKTKGQ